MSRRTATKTELVSALIMLIVAAIMLTSSSFAWYTISRSATFQAPTISMQATQNIEIAKAVRANTVTYWSHAEQTHITKNFVRVPFEVNAGQAGDYQYWGGTITSFTAIKSVNPGTWISSSNELCLRSYGSDGRRNGYLTATATEFNTSGERLYKTSTGVIVGSSRLIWLRTNTAGSIIMVTGKCRVVTSTSMTAVTEGYISSTAVTIKTTDTGLGLAIKIQVPTTRSIDGTSYGGVFHDTEESLHNTDYSRSALATAYLDDDGDMRFKFGFIGQANVPYLVELINFFDGEYIDDDEALSDDVTTYYIDGFHWINATITPDKVIKEYSGIYIN